MVELVETGDGHTEVQLPTTEPALHEPIDIVCAQRIKGTLLRAKRPGFNHEWRRSTIQIPTEHITLDLVLPAGVYEGSTVEFRQHLYKPAPPVYSASESLSASELRADVDLMELSAEDPSLDSHIGSGYQACLYEVLNHEGIEISTTRIIRVSKRYPELNSSVTTWIELA